MRKKVELLKLCSAELQAIFESGLKDPEQQNKFKLHKIL